MKKAELAAEIAAIEKIEVETLKDLTAKQLKARLDELLDTGNSPKLSAIEVSIEKGKVVITDENGKQETVPFRGGKRKAVIIGIIQKTKDRIIISSKPKVNRNQIESAILLGLCKIARVGLDVESIQSETAKKLLTSSKVAETCDNENITIADLLTIQDAYCTEYGITSKIETDKV